MLESYNSEYRSPPKLIKAQKYTLNKLFPDLAAFKLNMLGHSPLNIEINRYTSIYDWNTSEIICGLYNLTADI